MRTLLTLALATIPLAAAPVPKSLKKDPHPLNGTWQVVEWHIDDSRMKLSDTIFWTIDGENLAVRGVGDEVPQGFQSNVTRTLTRPEGGAADAIDYTIISADGSPPDLRPAVVQLDGDTLSLCLTSTSTGVRPTECKPTRGAIMYVLKRADAK